MPLCITFAFAGGSAFYLVSRLCGIRFDHQGFVLALHNCEVLILMIFVFSTISAAIRAVNPCLEDKPFLRKVVTVSSAVVTVLGTIALLVWAKLMWHSLSGYGIAKLGIMVIYLLGVLILFSIALFPIMLVYYMLSHVLSLLVWPLVMLWVAVVGGHYSTELLISLVAGLRLTAVGTYDTCKKLLRVRLLAVAFSTVLIGIIVSGSLDAFFERLRASQLSLLGVCFCLPIVAFCRHLATSSADDIWREALRVTCKRLQDIFANTGTKPVVQLEGTHYLTATSEQEAEAFVLREADSPALRRIFALQVFVRTLLVLGAIAGVLAIFTELVLLIVTDNKVIRVEYQLLLALIIAMVAGATVAIQVFTTDFLKAEHLDPFRKKAENWQLAMCWYAILGCSK